MLEILIIAFIYSINPDGIGFSKPPLPSSPDLLEI